MIDGSSGNRDAVSRDPHVIMKEKQSRFTAVRRGMLRIPRRTGSAVRMTEPAARPP